MGLAWPLGINPLSSDIQPRARWPLAHVHYKSLAFDSPGLGRTKNAPSQGYTPGLDRCSVQPKTGVMRHTCPGCRGRTGCFASLAQLLKVDLLARSHRMVTGFDISRAMIEYARLQVSLQHLENIRFEVLDAASPLPFADASFDLVNARTIASFMLASAWPNFMRECVWVLRPGGILRLTETDS
jgi:SAM-dependent methyltransferase